MAIANLFLLFSLFLTNVYSFSQITHPRVFAESLHKRVEQFVNTPEEEIYETSQTVKLVQSLLIENIDEVLSIADASVSDPWGQCVEDLYNVTQANVSENFKFWDSYAIPYTGYAMLRTIFPGQFEECVNAKTGFMPVMPYFPESTPFMVTLTFLGGKFSVTTGVCMPLSCSEKRVEQVFFWTLKLKAADLNIDSVHAVGRETFEPDSAFGIAAFVFSVLVVTVGVATTVAGLKRLHGMYIEGEKRETYIKVINLEEPGNSNDTKDGTNANEVKKAPEMTFGEKFCNCFDFYTNFTKILAVPKEQNPNQLPVLNGMRVLSLGWVIIGHTLLLQTFAMDNFLYLYERSSNLLFQVIVNATPSVDTFFVMSGLLVMLGTMKTMDKMKSNFGSFYFWMLFYIHRLIRLWPTMLLTILFVVGIYPQLGPVFYSTFYQNTESTSMVYLCRGFKWMPSAFFFNNIYEPESSCIAWVWYVANDMQFFLLSPFFIVAARMNKLIGYSSILFVIGVNSLLVLIASGVNKAPPGDSGGGAFTNPDFINDFDSTSIWATSRLYFSPYCRFQTYGIGLIVGLILYQKEMIEKKINQIPVPTRCGIITGLWVFGFACGIVSIYGCYPYAQGGHFGIWAAAFYNATFRVLWGIFVGILIVLCTLGYGGIINSILSSNFWVPFARVNYTTYIIHLVLLEMYVMTLEQNTHFTTINYTLISCGLLFCINSLSLVCSCFIEAPFIHLEKILLGRSR